MRADSGFYAHAIVAVCRKMDVRYSITIAGPSTKACADDVVELHVHLGQRLLHMLDMVGCVLHQHDPLPQVAA